MDGKARNDSTTRKKVSRGASVLAEVAGNRPTTEARAEPMDVWQRARALRAQRRLQADRNP